MFASLLASSVLIMLFESLVMIERKVMVFNAYDCNVVRSSRKTVSVLLMVHLMIWFRLAVAVAEVAIMMVRRLSGNRTFRRAACMAVVMSLRLWLIAVMMLTPWVIEL